jgi:hypothetical protein
VSEDRLHDALIRWWSGACIVDHRAAPLTSPREGASSLPPPRWSCRRQDQRKQEGRYSGCAWSGAVCGGRISSACSVGCGALSWRRWCCLGNRSHHPCPRPRAAPTMIRKEDNAVVAQIGRTDAPARDGGRSPLADGCVLTEEMRY